MQARPLPEVSLDFDLGIENRELDEASNGSTTKRNRTCVLGAALPGGEGGPREAAIAAP